MVTNVSTNFEVKKITDKSLDRSTRNNPLKVNKKMKIKSSGLNKLGIGVGGSICLASGALGVGGIALATGAKLSVLGIVGKGLLLAAGAVSTAVGGVVSAPIILAVLGLVGGGVLLYTCVKKHRENNITNSANLKPTGSQNKESNNGDSSPLSPNQELLNHNSNQFAEILHKNACCPKNIFSERLLVSDENQFNPYFSEQSHKSDEENIDEKHFETYQKCSEDQQTDKILMVSDENQFNPYFSEQSHKIDEENIFENYLETYENNLEDREFNKFFNKISRNSNNYDDFNFEDTDI